MPLSLRKSGLLMLAAVIFTGCADVREIKAFAVTSQQVMDKNRLAPFGYYTYSQDSAMIFDYLPDHLRDVDCPCDAAKRADSNIAREYGLLSTYFAALAKFADPKASINFAPMGAPLPAGKYGSVVISTQEAGIASRLALALTTLSTTRYKAKRIPAFLATYRDSVAPLIRLLRVRADNLAGRIGNLQLQLRRVADSLIGYSERREMKMPVLFAYDAKRKELEATLTAYQQRVRDLDAIIAGGELLVDNIDKLHTKPFREKMMSIVNTLVLNANLKF
jgi:hypothetical protein